MKKTAVEVSVGIFVLIGLACLGYLTIKLGKMELLGGGFYQVNAHFSSVSGLKTGAIVDMAGVQIGKVSKIDLDPETKEAVVTMDIDKGVAMFDDVIASVKTSGLIGEKYVRLEPGGMGEVLKPGGRILETESAVDIEDLIGKFAYGDTKTEN